MCRVLCTDAIYILCSHTKCMDGSADFLKVTKQHAV